MTPLTESMTEWFRRPASRPSLAAFGKHPGWDDHIPGIGVDTEALAHLKQALYSDGIRGQIDSGAWEKMEQTQRIEGFDHLFLWSHPGCALLGLMWSSTDRIGRAKYPMILCAEGDGFSPAFMLAHAKPELERLRDTCKALASAEDVTSECRAALDRLKGTFERERDGWIEPFSDSVERQRFIDCAELSPDHAGFLRILHEYSTERRMASSRTNTKHLRVPVISSLQADAFTPWVEFFKCVVPSKIPVLFIKRNGAAWLDVIIGEPISHDFFCLKASADALPLTTRVPYEISPRTISTFDTVVARLRLSTGQSSPKAPPVPTTAPGVPAGSKTAARSFILVGIIFIVVLAVIVLVLLFNSRNHPAKNGAPALNKSGTPSAVAALLLNDTRVKLADAVEENTTAC